MHVISCCLLEKGAKDLEQAAKANGPGTLNTVLMDVSKEESVAKALVEIKKLVGTRGVHALINNAGVLRGELFDTMEMAQWDFQLGINVVGAARVAKALLPQIIAARGRIINVASVAGIFGTEGTVAYNASKFAVVGMSDAMRRELAHWGVTVSMILPGIMNTPVEYCACSHQRHVLVLTIESERCLSQLWDVPLAPANIDRIWNGISTEQKEFYGAKEVFVKMYQASFLSWGEIK